jgi:DNA-binding GntR family transcriptional regulator
MKQSASLTEGTYERIRDDLIACRLAPGERLKTNDLSVSMGVSLGVVREALSRLTAEGFVLAEPQRGFRAAPLSLDELAQLAEATVALEGLCLRRAIEVGDLEWETRVTAAHYRLANTPLYEENDQSRISRSFSDAYAQFRRALLSACDNEWMLRMRDMLHAQSERYRQVCTMLGPKHFEYHEGYAAIVAAALQRDADRAVSLLSERLQKNALTMRKALENSNLLPQAATRDFPASPTSKLRRLRTQ